MSAVGPGEHPDTAQSKATADSEPLGGKQHASTPAQVWELKKGSKTFYREKVKTPSFLHPREAMAAWSQPPAGSWEGSRQGRESLCWNPRKAKQAPALGHRALQWKSGSEPSASQLTPWFANSSQHLRPSCKSQVSFLDDADLHPFNQAASGMEARASHVRSRIL